MNSTLAMMFTMMFTFMLGLSLQAAENSVTVDDAKATALMELMTKTGAIQAGAGDCTNAGSCYQAGTLVMNCRYPMNQPAEAGQSTSCAITAMGQKKVVSLEDSAAKKIMNLVESAHGTDEADSPCGAGYLCSSGKITATCKYANDARKNKIYTCEVSPVKAPAGAAKKVAPAKAVRPVGGGR